MGKALQAVGGAALIGGAIVGAVLDPAMAPLWWSLGSMGVSMEVGVLAQALEGSQGNFSVKQAAAPGQVIYGMTRTAGNIVWASTTGGDKDYLHLVIVWAIHPCQSIEQIYIDGKAVYLDGLDASGSPMAEPDNNVLNLSGLPTAGNALNTTYKDINGNNYNWHNCCCVYQHLGGSTSVNPFINYLTPNDPNYPSAAYFNGLTATYLKLIWNSNNFTGGIPEIRATIRGNKSVYDPRSGVTGWSDNTALCINNVMCDTNFGAGCIYGTEINQAQLIAAANICDAQVNLAAGGSESCYTCNGSFQTSSSPGDEVQSMLTSCAGRLTYTSGQFGIFPGAWLGTTGAEITTSNTIGNPSYTATRKYRDLVNLCTGTFICPTYPFAIGYSFDYQDSELTVFNGCWQPTSFPYWTNDSLHGYVTATDYITQDQGRTLTTDLKLQYVISVATAQRIAKINVMRNRFQGAATFPCNLSMWGSTALDNIEVLFPYLGLGGSTFEIQSIKFNVEGDPGQPEESPKLTTELELSATDPSVYAWSTSEELGILITASPTVNDAFQIASPTGLTLVSGEGTAFVNESGVVTGRINASWTSPTDIFIVEDGYLEVQWQVAGASYWDTSGLIGGGLENYLCGPCLGNTSYNVRVRGQRPAGVSSGWVQVSAYTCVMVGSTMDATDMYYPDGQTVAALEPAMAGADITNVMTPVMITNPAFEAGSTGWVLGTNVSIQKIPASSYQGSWVALSSGHTGVGFTYLLNQQPTAVKPGQVVTAQCMVNASQPTAGYVQVVVQCNNATTTLANIPGNAVAAGTPGWNLSAVVAVCPPGTISVYIAAFIYGAPTTGNFFIDNFTANFQTTSLTEVPDDANYAKLATSQTTSNQINGVYGSGAGVGVSAQTSVTNQDLALNCLFNSQFTGTTGDAITGTGSDGQPAAPTGLDVWHPYSGGTAPAFQGGGIVEMQTPSTGGITLLHQYLSYEWLGVTGQPFCLGVQVAWLSGVEPNSGFSMYVACANSITSWDGTIGLGNISASIPASALSNSQFQTCILEGTLPLSGTYTNGYVIVFQHTATNTGFLIIEPMMTYGGIMPIWTSQYPTAPVTTPLGNFPYLYPTNIRPAQINTPTGSPYCPTLEMRLFPSLTVGDAKVGDMLDCVDTQDWKPYRAPILKTSEALRECVRLTAANGAVLEVSVETPFTLKDGSILMAREMRGREVLTDHAIDGMEWSGIAQVEHIGERQVKLIGAGGVTFAAGRDERRIFSHNAYKTA